MPGHAPAPPRLGRVNLSAKERDGADLAAGRRLLEDAAKRTRSWASFQRPGETPEATRRKVLDRLRVDAQVTTRALTGRLLRGELTRDAWQRQMRAALVPAHYAAAMAGTGVTSLDGPALAGVQAQIRTQVGYLARFRADLATGGTALDGRALTRADLYGAAVWTTGQAARAAQAQREGHDEERGVLGVSDHCESCVDRADQGWVAIGELLPIGAGLCRSRCACWIEYRGRPASRATHQPPPKALPQNVGIGGLADGQRFVLPPDLDGHSLVLADVAKVDRSLATDPGYHVGPGGSGAGIAGRYEEAQRSLERARPEGIPIHASRLGVDGAGEAYVTDGRHRFAALRDSGAVAVPVAIEKSQVAEFRKAFGYRSE